MYSLNIIPNEICIKWEHNGSEVCVLNIYVEQHPCELLTVRTMISLPALFLGSVSHDLPSEVLLNLRLSELMLNANTGIGQENFRKQF